MSKVITPQDEYDKSKIFEDEIRPLLKQIEDICLVNDMPIFFSCATKNMDGKTFYERDGILTGSNGINLYDDWFRLYLLVGHVDLKPTTKFAQFNEESLGADAMDYINNTPLEDEDESKMTASVGEGMSFGNKFEQAKQAEQGSFEDVRGMIKEEFASIRKELLDLASAKNELSGLKESIKKEISDEISELKKDSDKALKETKEELSKCQDMCKNMSQEMDELALDSGNKGKKQSSILSGEITKAKNSVKELSDSVDKRLEELEGQMRVLRAPKDPSTGAPVSESLGDLL